MADEITDERLLESQKAGYEYTQIPGTPEGALSLYRPPEVATSANEADIQKDEVEKSIKEDQERIIPGIEEIPGVTSVTQFGTEQQALITQRQAQLTERQKAETERINREFELLKERQAQAQKEEVGATSVKLARMGGYLGEGTAGMQYQVSLEQSHRQEMRDLEGKRQSVLMQAQQAYEDMDFELSQQMLDEARATEQTIYNRQRQYQQDQAEARKTALEEQKAKAEAETKRREYALEYNIQAPYYTIDGQNVVDTRTGEYINIEDLPEGAQIQQIKRIPKSTELKTVTMGDSDYLYDIVTGEYTYLGPAKRNIKYTRIGGSTKNPIYGFVDEDNMIFYNSAGEELTGDTLGKATTYYWESTAIGRGGGEDTKLAAKQQTLINDLSAFVMGLARKGKNREEIWEAALDEYEGEFMNIFPDEEPGDIIHSIIYKESTEEGLGLLG